MAPLLSDGGGFGVLGIASPYWPRVSLGCYPLHFRTEPGLVRMGSKEAVEPLRRPCSWTTPPYPQSRPISLLAALWVGSRSSAYGHMPEPGAMHQEGVKSVRSCTLVRADVQDVCKSSRQGKICHMGERYLTGCSIAVLETLRARRLWGFLLCGQQNRFAHRNRVNHWFSWQQIRH